MLVKSSPGGAPDDADDQMMPEPRPGQLIRFAVRPDGPGASRPLSKSVDSTFPPIAAGMSVRRIGGSLLAY